MSVRLPLVFEDPWHALAPCAIEAPAKAWPDPRPTILVHRIAGRDDRRLVTLYSSHDRPLGIAVDQGAK